jgi:hypothetical protein
MQKKHFIVIVIVIIAIFTGVAFLFIGVGNQYQGPPVLTISEEEGDLGKIKPDQPQTYLFTVKNEGGEPLIIERVQTSCGCTATVLSDDEILPGEVTQLEVTFNPRGYEGEVTQSVYIYSNDPENPKKRIAIKADVEHISAPQIHLSTNQWDLGLLAEGDSTALSVTVSNKGDLVLEIENIEVPSSVQYNQETPDFPIKLAPGEQIDLNFSYNASGETMGIVREYIRLVSNDPNHKNVTLRIEGYIREKEEVISIYPSPNFMVTEETGGGIYEAKFLIKNNSNTTLDQISIQSSHEYLKPINQEIILLPGEEKEVTVRIEQESLANIDFKEVLQEYLYFKIALPVTINLDQLQ